MFDSLPAALLALFLAVCVLWLMWRVFRRLLTPRRRRLEPSLADEAGNTRIEPPVPQTAAAAVSTIPDAADVLALKASIDNLARQVAALEKRLAAGQTSLPPQPLPSDRTVAQSPVIPSVSPDHRI
ncbi:hypothetical protein ILT44_01985 [Microvirga sp. BT689]|uniref:hypothetical protein n=1 Tax=Microvirga arvi TaxID=2778731 RepID=UPI0019521007|nr:hypothetical protein [Microvirga arvi]MBM6578937.1 hypothetical protein [Microvirga arvi]